MRPAIPARPEQPCLEHVGIVVVEGQGGYAGGGRRQIGEAARVPGDDGDAAALPRKRRDEARQHAAAAHDQVMAAQPLSRLGGLALLALTACQAASSRSIPAAARSLDAFAAHAVLHGAEAALEFGVGAAQRRFRIDTQMAQQIDADEEQIAAFIGDGRPCRRRRSRP